MIALPFERRATTDPGNTFTRYAKDEGPTHDKDDVFADEVVSSCGHHIVVVAVDIMLASNGKTRTWRDNRFTVESHAELYYYTTANGGPCKLHIS